MNTFTKHTTLQEAEALSPHLVSIRREIHANPELSFAEEKTAKLVTQRLTEAGYKVQSGIGGTGLMAEIGSGRTIIVRADMDALPIIEENNAGYCSKNSGVMHACGHDAHTTCALGAALLLAKNPPAKGCVRFLFQPAEETTNDDGKSGATLMIEAGATKNCEGVIALHCDPRLETGTVALRQGPLLSACDSFEIIVKGTQSHGAYPEFGIDAVVLSARVIDAVQTIVSRRKSALEPAVITIGGIRSKTFRSNIICEEVELIGTARYFEPALGDLIKEELNRACNIVENLGGTFELKYTKDSPALVNNKGLVEVVKKTACELLGKENVKEAKREMGADDFAFISNHMPGCYFLLGTKLEGDLRFLHTPTFDIDERTLPIGAALLAQSAKDFLQGLYS